MRKDAFLKELGKPAEKKVCRKCGFRSSEKTLWICPNCHSDTFEREANLSPEDLANLKAGRSAF